MNTFMPKFKKKTYIDIHINLKISHLLYLIFISSDLSPNEVKAAN